MKLFEDTDYTNTPIFIILRSNGITKPDDILKMSISLLDHNDFPVYPALVSICGINIIDKIVSEEHSRILISESIVSYAACSGFSIQMQKQCEKLYQTGCSVITTLPKDADFELISKKMEEIGYYVKILDELNNVEFDLPSLRCDEKQPSIVVPLMKKFHETHMTIQSSDDHWVVLSKDNPDDPERSVYFAEKDRFITKYPFRIYIGKTEVDCIENPDSVFIGWVEAKQMYCPHCMKDIVLGRDSQKNPFTYHPCFDLHSELVLIDESAFWRHVGICPPQFPGDGIYEIQTDGQRKIAAILSLIAKRECGWDSPSIGVNSFEKGARAFILIQNGAPLSYLAFQRREFDGIGLKYILWDLFTFPAFRKQGLSSSLLDHAIEVLDIDKDLFFISFPVRVGAKTIIMNRVGKEVAMIRLGRNEKINKNDLLKNWEDINSD
jgi:GNAT superfamily N-acetyltransferase